MKIKTSELIGSALKYVVALTEEQQGNLRIYQARPGSINVIFAGDTYWVPFTPDEDWAHGGPIIEREKITLDPFDDSPNWCATIPGYMYRVYGPTPLIAAMRCYVASKLGDEVDVSEELV